MSACEHCTGASVVLIVSADDTPGEAEYRPCPGCFPALGQVAS